MRASVLPGGYAMLRGSLYLLFGAGAAVLGMSFSIGPSFAGVLMIGMGGLLLLAGGSLVAGSHWARYLLVVLLGLDALRNGLLLATGGFGLFTPIWFGCSLLTVGHLLFVNPIETTERADLDEDQSVHSIGSLRR